MRNLIFLIAGMIAYAAVFAQDVVITEINYNSAPAYDTEDWLEFYNNADFVADMSGWLFKDANDSNIFVFPEHTYLDIGEFLVLCRDTAAFKGFNPEVDNIIGNIDFNLSNGGELIRLYDDQENIVDSLTYDDQPPWPIEPDGSGLTLELINPDLPNEDPESWVPSDSVLGTPGRDNGWVGVKDITPETGPPTEFRLLPNYPNPFNPQTTLTYHLPKAGRASLLVYDLEGREVVRLADGWHVPGVYKVVFSSAQMPSGLYFARLTARDFQQTQKLLLMK